MDFGTLLNVAQKNGTASKQTTACYQTKFAPPKKQSKQTKTLSANIKKFLARKEEEERQKADEEKKKRENLLALRDHKAQSRINKHLKVCKAANKSVLADAVDNDNTAVTMAGPSQPDEDDYGYVSQEASAFYNQLMTKYSNAPPPKPIFSTTGKKTIKDIASTKDRVKQALKQQEAEEALGHRRKRKSTVKESEVEQETEPEERSERNEDKKEKDEKSKAKRKPMPPPIDFGELLKIAEKKQHEPVMIDVKPKIEEPERLMTKKQRLEFAKEKEWRERKEQREKYGDSKTVNAASLTSKSGKPAIGKIPKTSERSQVTSMSAGKAVAKITPVKKPAVSMEKTSDTKSNNNSGRINISRTSERDTILEERKKLEAEKKKLEEMRQAIEEEKKRLGLNRSKQEDAKSIAKCSMEKSTIKPKTSEKQASSKDLKQKSPPLASGSKLRAAIMANNKPKQFPPTDLKPLKSKHVPSWKNVRKPMGVNKRRIDDDDEEYDSELDDFIDDGVQEESEDYSKYISEIFGYDKSKYRNIDNEDDGDMESSFAQQLKEEYVSAKIGIMEDLEDIRMEALEKKRKALMRKKVKK